MCYKNFSQQETFKICIYLQVDWPINQMGVLSFLLVFRSFHQNQSKMFCFKNDI